MATTFPIIIAPTGLGGSITAGASSRRRIVRFDSECVLIPEAQQKHKRPRMATRVYSVPLWKRRNSFTSDPEGAQAPVGQPSPVDTHVIFKVPVLSFSSKKSRSSSRSPTSPKPCLVHRAPNQFLVPSASPLKPRRPRTPNRSPSLPLPTTVHHFPEPGCANLPTIPLRACCPDCYPITEQCMREGVVWQEKFTREARRRRSASLDSQVNDPCDTRHLTPPLSAPAVSAGDTDFQIVAGLAKHNHGFAAIYPRDLSSSPVVASRFSGPGSPCAITVDEIDKRRRSIELPADVATSYLHLRDMSGSSATSASSATSSNNEDPLFERRKPSASPIAELDEDEEDQLFPLPSPRRSPCVSPAPGSNDSRSRSPSTRSATPSPVNSIPPSPAPSFPPSPNGSNVCLGRGSSRDSLPILASGSDDALARSVQRKAKRMSSGSERGRDRCDKGFLTPPDRPSKGRTNDSKPIEEPGPTKLSIEIQSDSPSPPPSHATPRNVLGSPSTPKPTPTIQIPLSPSEKAAQRTPTAFASTSSMVCDPPMRTQSEMHTSSTSPRPTESPGTEKEKSGSVKRARSLSSPGGKRRRPSFGAAAILRAGADVLKGVSSIGMGMGMNGGGSNA